MARIILVLAAIRNAVETERDLLRELHRRSSFIWEEDRAMLAAHPEVFGVAPEAIGEGRVRVAVDDQGGLVGFSGFSFPSATVSRLDDLFVEPDHLRAGIGTALIQDAMTRAREAGRSAMTVVAHSRTFPFYESAGFEVVGPAQTQFGPAFELRRSLRR